MLPRPLALVPVALAAALPVLAQGAPTPPPRPNILFVFTDDHASHSISAYGSKINETPNIDRIAREGMLFRNCFVTNSICAPSRAVILTGKHSHLNGQITNAEAFDGTQQTFPKLMQRAGYQTALIGKWHLRSDPTGFDYWDVLIGQGPYYNPTMKSAEGRRKIVGYTTDIITDLALEWLQEGRDGDKPFVLMYQHKAPHREWAPGPKHLDLFSDRDLPVPETLFDDPLAGGRANGRLTQEMTLANHFFVRDMKFVAPRNLTPEQLEKWDAAYGPRNAAYDADPPTGDARTLWRYQRYIKDYLRCIASVDDNLGRVLDYLDQTGLADNTVVVYSSDQGFFLGDHGWYDKRWMLEESLRTPLIVRWPGVTKAGSEDTHLVQNLDFAPTFLALAGAEVPGDMQGESIVPLLKGGTPDGGWRDAIYYHYFEYPGAHMVPRHCGVRTDRYKLIWYYQQHEWELFDLQEDPEELKNLYGSRDHAQVVVRLRQRLRELQEQYDDTDPTQPRGRFELAGQLTRSRAVETEQVFAAADGRSAKVPQDVDPTVKPLTASAHCALRADAGPGVDVVLAQGGDRYGWALYLVDGVPRFCVRSRDELLEVRAADGIARDRAVPIVGGVTKDGEMFLRVDGREVARLPGMFVSAKPADGLAVGRDPGAPVGEYPDASRGFRGVLTNMQLWWGTPGMALLEGR